jgi:hypothetical protein
MRGHQERGGVRTELETKRGWGEREGRRPHIDDSIAVDKHFERRLILIKKCQSCQKKKLLTEFEEGKSTCVDCLALSYVKKYGITPSQYRELLKQQNSLCAICKKPSPGRRLAVDHDHVTQQIRALLCSSCNSAIGLVGEDTQILAGMILYLESHKLAKS